MTKLMFKILLMGDVGTGKSALLNAYIQGTYKKNYVSGLKVEFYTKNEVVNDGTTVILKVEDSMTSSLDSRIIEKFLGYYLSDTSLVLLCYDLNNAQTLRDCTNWIEAIRDTNHKTNIGLVGCKSDLPLNADLEYADELTKKYNLEFHEETSAKEMINVNELLHRCADWCYKQVNSRN
jgi:small GTP-binding protein